MRSTTLKSPLIKSGLAAPVLLLAGGAAFAQQPVNLTAAGATATLPDGTTVPMWGYSCGTAVTGSTATCAKLNPASVSGTTPATNGWSPIVITVPTGQGLTINLTNHLAFGAAGAIKIPTSLVIVGQLGAGLGATATSTVSPDHSTAQSTVTWPIVGTGSGTPPVQGPRVQSFSTEVPATLTTSTTSTALTWP